MFSRLKHSLVESYVGALALGWILAWAILDFVSIFTAPITLWATRSEYRTALIPDPTSMLLRASLPYLVASPALFLLGYILLRWLYFNPHEQPTDPPSNPE
jgi:hypothetical protein